MKYKAKTKDCHLIVKAKASFGEIIDLKALDTFARIYLRGFLKPKMISGSVVEYSGPVGISLYERLKRPVSKRDFLFIMEQIVVAVQKLQSNNLPVNNVVLDIRYVFINDVTKEIQFLYVPSSKKTENPGVVAFIESIVYSVTPAAGKDTEFVSRFIYFLKSQKTFKPELVEKFIAKEDRSVVNTIKKQHAGQSGFMTSNHQHYYEHYDKRNNEIDNDPTGLLDEDDPTGLQSEDSDATGLLDEDDVPTGLLSEDSDATGLLSDDEATGLLNEANETGLLDEDDNATGLLYSEVEDGTTLLDESRAVRYPNLFRVLTEETIAINKPVFRIGKERSYVDYFVTNNNAVSRSHADIITRGRKCFVIDLNSKNHTYINDCIIAVQHETEIRNGDRLRLGNEEFIFRT